MLEYKNKYKSEHCLLFCSIDKFSQGVKAKLYITMIFNLLYCNCYWHFDFLTRYFGMVIRIYILILSVWIMISYNSRLSFWLQRCILLIFCIFNHPIGTLGFETLHPIWSRPYKVGSRGQANYDQNCILCIIKYQLS